MGWDLESGLNRTLTSWKSLSDPSMGISFTNWTVVGSGDGSSKRIGEAVRDRAVEWISVRWDSGDFGGTSPKSCLPENPLNRQQTREMPRRTHNSP
ncbi:hypothetical protein Scep_007092 [Stephania cephalantha]|uniref:Uncharacterized protein n=1 Tax=Stephania cephalantha TaxID=152367 RepID=A0AAP0KBW6_9MAGN